MIVYVFPHCSPTGVGGNGAGTFSQLSGCAARDLNPEPAD